MIPTVNQARALWKTYDLPEKKQTHCLLVAEVAFWLATHVEKNTHILLSKDALYIAGLLHDIDKNIVKRPGETHPDAGVRILQQLGMDEIASLVRSHPLHAILDESISPKTVEEKILYLADKMTKYEVISVDERFRLWHEEELSQDEQRVLEKAYPKVKQLEAEICSLLQMDLEKMIKYCKNDILQQERETV